MCFTAESLRASLSFFWSGVGEREEASEFQLNLKIEGRGGLCEEEARDVCAGDGGGAGKYFFRGC